MIGDPFADVLEPEDIAGILPATEHAAALAGGQWFGPCSAAVERAQLWGERGAAYAGDLSVIAAANHEADHWIAAALYLIGGRS